ncbi:MAG: hypothetical protein IMF08_12690 [Proteobacteria bacterium]|nr:hypothetical protein [Pseudomonadota bacterium]
MDDAILSLALRDAFPTTVFYPSGRPLTAPRLELCRTIPECGSSVVTAYAPAPGWQPEFEEYKDNPRWYVIRNPPRRYLHYSRTSWFWGSWEPAHWAFDLPTPEFGTISTNYDPNDAEQRAFVNGVWKIISKLATNRMKSGISKDRVVLSENVGGGMIWAGHNLLKWCALKPGRMIDGSHLPCDDWKFPETPWYRDLHARAVAMFGPEFGGAPEK